VAITCIDDRPPFGSVPAIPAAVDPAWTRLGYDVADGSFFPSALSNCGLGATGEGIAWATHLNEHHLFRELDLARRFRARVDELVPEHAPFLVLGLYLVP
jgi:hypothetical protein